MKNLIIPAILLIAFTSSCKKDLMNEQAPTPSTQVAKVEKFNQIKTNDAFNWENSKTIDFSVSGMEDMQGIINTLKISDVSGKVEYLKVRLAMNENFQTKLSIPGNVSAVKVTYGTIIKTYNPQAGSVNFNYITEVAE
jgi:hypothetical protein